MNYDQARQLDLGGWHWTTMNDGNVRTAWPCKKYIGPADRPYTAAYDPSEWQQCTPHPTREDAERHFYDACLAEVKEEEYSDWTGCRAPGCDTPTKKGLGNSGYGRLFNGTPLCDAHRNRDALHEMHPFTPGVQLIHS